MSNKSNGLILSIPDKKTTIYLDQTYRYLLLAGCSLYVIVFLYFIYNSETNYLLFGNIMACLGMTYLALGYYNKQPLTEVYYRKDVMTGHIILAVYLFLSFFLPINKNSRLTDIIGIISNSLLITDNPLYILGLILVTVFFILKSTMYASFATPFTVTIFIGSILITLGFIIAIYVYSTTVLKI